MASCAAPPNARRRDPSTAVRPGRGRRSAPPAGTSRSAPRPSPRRGAPAADDAALDRRRAARLDQLPEHRRRRAPPRARAGGAGGSRARRRMIGPISGSRRKRWWKSAMSSSTPRAKRMRSIAGSSSAAPAGRGSSPGERDRQPRRVDRLGAEGDPVAGRQPGPHQDRARSRREQPRRDPALDPQGAVIAAEPRQPEGRSRTSTSSLEAIAHRSSRWTSTRKERLAMTFRRLAAAREPARERCSCRADRGDRAHGGDGRGPGQDPAGGGDRGAAHLGARTGKAEPS